MVRYTKELDHNNSIREDIIKKIDGDVISFIPCVEGNKDYAEYLEWELQEGNDIEIPEIPQYPEE